MPLTKGKLSKESTPASPDPNSVKQNVHKLTSPNAAAQNQLDAMNIENRPGAQKRVSTSGVSNVEARKEEGLLAPAQGVTRTLSKSIHSHAGLPKINTMMEDWKQKAKPDNQFVAFPMDESKQMLLSPGSAEPRKNSRSRSATIKASPGPHNSMNSPIYHASGKSTQNLPMVNDKSVKSALAHHKELTDKFNAMLNAKGITAEVAGDVNASVTPTAMEEIIIFEPSDTNTLFKQDVLPVQKKLAISVNASQKRRRGWRIAFAAQRIGYRMSLITKQVLDEFRSQYSINPKDKAVAKPGGSADTFLSNHVMANNLA